MENMDMFKKLILVQKESIEKIINDIQKDPGPSTTIVTLVLESEKRMVDNFILFIDALSEKK